MKLKDYEIPQYGLDDGGDQQCLEQYSLKNFDLKAYQLAQNQPVPEPISGPSEPSPFTPEADSTGALEAAREAPSFRHAANPAPAELSQLAPAPGDVHFGAHFNLTTVSYSPLSPAQSWKIPRWVITTVGLFFGSAAALMIAFCVVLLRDPTSAPAEPPAAPTATVVTTSAPLAPPTASSPINKAPSDATRPTSAPDRETATKGHLADSAPGRRIVVSRHPSVVRRQLYGSRRVVSRNTPSSVEPQETETATRRPAPDALDKLLSESSL